jgi:hypothetical protein
VHNRVPLARIAMTAGMRADAVEAALAALAVHGLVESNAGGWGMTTLGRRERRPAAENGGEELPFGWW